MQLWSKRAGVLPQLTADLDSLTNVILVLRTWGRRVWGHRGILYHCSFLKEGAEMLLCEAVNVKSKRHWRSQHVGVARIIGQPLRKSISIKHNRSKRQAVCAAGSRTGEMGLPKPLGAQVRLSKNLLLSMELLYLVFGLVCSAQRIGSRAFGIKSTITQTKK